MADWRATAGPCEASEAELTTLAVAKLIKLSTHGTDSLPPSLSLARRTRMPIHQGIFYYYYVLA